MGLTTIALDGDPQAQGFCVADFSYVVDVRNKTEALKIAKKHNVHGVLTIASDICVPTVAYVAKGMNLPGIDPKVAEVATNKFLMRRKFKEFHLPSPRFFQTKSLTEVRQIASILKYPFVIKPVDNAGSRGVSVVTKKEGLKCAFELAKKNSRIGELILEEFIEGIECTIEAMSYEGKTEILAISDKKKPDGKYRVATDLVYPADFPKGIIGEIKRVIKLAIKAIGIEMGPTHSEVIVTPQGRPVLVEVAARGGGFKVFSDVVFLASGVDAEKETIKMSLGLPVDIKPKFEKGVVLHFFAPPPGILKEVIGLEDLKSIPQIEVGLFKKVGDRIPPLATDGSRTGYLISWGKSRKEALKKVQTVENRIKFIVEAPDNLKSFMTNMCNEGLSI